MMNVPSAEEQIRFLNNIQRLFTEGGSTATHKYALLMALADLSVELEPHPGAAAIFPLNKLQTIGNESFCFLYDNPDIRTYGGNLHLKPGVAFHFRRFYPLIRSMIQEGWIRYIRELKANHNFLGTVNDLGQFLFGSNRQDLSVFREILLPIQEGQCFYCLSSLSRGMSDVDHFVPWTRYSLDLAHNFVIAHSSCNNNKRDFLPDVSHLERWTVRNRSHDTYLREAFDRINLAHDLNASVHITRWAYEQAELSGASVWSAKDILLPLSTSWKKLLLSS